MTDHPFDEIAVQDAVKAMYAHKQGGLEIGLPFDRLPEPVRGMWTEKATAALTAACKSMKDRGLVMDGTAIEGSTPDYWSVTQGTERRYNSFPVTIIRHKEQP